MDSATIAGFLRLAVYPQLPQYLPRAEQVWALAAQRGELWVASSRAA